MRISITSLCPRILLHSFPPPYMIIRSRHMCITIRNMKPPSPPPH